MKRKVNYKLKTIPRIIAIILLIASFIKLYTMLGYSTEWYELAGWLVEFCIITFIYELFEPFNEKFEEWIKTK